LQESNQKEILMQFITDNDQHDLSVHRMLNVITDAGLVLANTFSKQILAMEERENRLHVRWASTPSQAHKEAIEQAWLSTPGRTGNIVHEDYLKLETN
jgi:hypothetical protein